MHHFVSLLALCVALVGCSADQAYRLPVEQPRSFVAGQANSYSLEDHAYQVQDDAGHFYLGYVEFDDQGWYHDIRQQQGLLSWLRAQHASAPNRQFLLVTYAHGWKHNASAFDSDVDNFRKLLQTLAIQEQAAQRLDPGHTARTVVGVYLGWRGESIKVPLFKELTFWTRKNAAERVGHRSAKDLLMLLNQFRAFSNGWCTSNILAGPHETQLVFIGHSFGGLLMYNALQTEITDRALRLNKAGDFRTAKSFGDFVLLINPAFEGASYESLWQAGLMRTYSGNQRPIMAIVTSDADWVTRVAFPAGRFYTFAQSAPHDGERDTVLYAIGHLERYRTHTLAASAAPPSKPQSQRSVTEAAATLTAIQSQKSAPTAPGETLVFDHGILTRLDNPKGIPNFPYLSVYTDASMIRDHSDIWNDKFRDFMFEFVTKQVMEYRERSASPASCGPDD
jgi:hypothetical protein